MQIVFGIVVVVLLTVGVRAVVNRLSAAGQQRYAAARTKLADWRAAQATRPAPPPSPLAIKLGTVAGGVTQGAVLAWSAGVPGLRLGWAVGRDRVRRWWEETRPPESLRDYLARNRAQRSDPEPQPTRDADGHLMFGDDPSDPNGTGECPECHGALLVQDGQEVCPLCLTRQQMRNDDYEQQIDGRPNLRLVPNQPEQPAGGAVPVIDTIGEVSTVADLRADLEGVVNQTLAEIDDATAEVGRRQREHDRRVYLAEVAPTIVDKDPRTQTAIGALTESSRRSLERARARLADTEAAHVQARHALAELNRHRPMEEAAAATPQASTRTETYQPQ